MEYSIFRDFFTGMYTTTLLGGEFDNCHGQASTEEGAIASLKNKSLSIKKETLKYNDMNVITTFELVTENRGTRTFTIAQDKNGKYYAHELGGITPIDKVLNTPAEIAQRYAHRLNPNVRRGNQYGTFLKPLGYNTVEDAQRRCELKAKQHITYCTNE